MENKRYELCFAGSGGQGVILGSIIYAQAAVNGGLYTVQSQSYGPEARGGSCCAEAILSETPIHYTKCTHTNFLLALTQSALNKYLSRVCAGGLLLMDESLEKPDRDDLHIVALPILKTAKEEVGNPMTANILAVGAINALLELVDDEALLDAVKRNIPRGTEQINLKAYEAGKALGASAKGRKGARK